MNDKQKEYIKIGYRVVVDESLVFNKVRQCKKCGCKNIVYVRPLKNEYSWAKNGIAYVTKNKIIAYCNRDGCTWNVGVINKEGTLYKRIIAAMESADVGKENANGSDL